MGKEYIFKIDGVLWNEETNEGVMKPEYVAPLIRCKDCKYYDRTMHVHARCGCTIQGKIFGMVRCEDDDFCSYGERKNE